MKHSNVNLAALIGSRICHDLISPIGAISNGLELLEMTKDASGPELALISDSVGHADARIRFFRIAYGAASDQPVAPGEVAGLLRDIEAGGRLSYSYLPQDGQTRHDLRLVFLGLQCFETAMPYGGSVRIDTQDGGWLLTGTADKMNLDAALWAGLSTGQHTTEITPALVQFALLPALLTDAARRATSQLRDTQITLSF